MSRRQNPRGPFEKRKQLLIYSFDKENITWPFHMTQTGNIYWKMVGCDSKLNEFIDMYVYFTLPGYIIPYHTILCHTIPYHTMPYHLHHTTSYHTIPYLSPYFACFQQLSAEKHNGTTITFGIRIEDDGTVLERKEGSEEYRIKTDEVKYSTQYCSIVIICMYCFGIFCFAAPLIFYLSLPLFEN